MFRILLLCLSAFVTFSCTATGKKDIKASDIIRLLQKGKDVQIADKIVWGDLDFTTLGNLKVRTPGLLQADVEGNIFFSNCVFMGKVFSAGKKGALPVTARFKCNLVFHECDFRGEVDFSNAEVSGMAYFGKSVFRENARFNQLSVWSKDSYFSEVKAEKDFSMVYSAFEGNLYFLDAVFGQKASFQEMSVQGKLSFNNAFFKEKAGLDLMSVNGAAFFNYAVFEKGADFSYSRFLHTADFINTTFGDKGNFEKTYFLNTVRFKEVDNHNLILKETYFGNKAIEN